MPAKRKRSKRKSSLLSFKRFSNRQVLTVVGLAAALGILFYFGSQAANGDSKVNAVVLEKTDNITAIQAARGKNFIGDLQPIKFRLYASGQLICGDGTTLSTAQLSNRQIGDALNSIKGTGVTKVGSANSTADLSQTLLINGNGAKNKIVQRGAAKDTRFKSAESKLQSICDQTQKQPIDQAHIPIPKGNQLPTQPAKAEISAPDKLARQIIDLVAQKAFAGSLSQGDEDDQYNRVNGARGNVGQPGVTRSACLTSAARAWAQQMAANNGLSHTAVSYRPDGPPGADGKPQTIPHDDFVENYCGGNQQAYGENIGVNTSSALMFDNRGTPSNPSGGEDHHSFMTSPCHRYTIQSQSWNHSYLGPDPSDSSKSVEYCDNVTHTASGATQEGPAGGPGTQPWSAVGVGAYRSDDGQLWVAQMFANCTNANCANYNNGGGGSAPPPAAANHDPYGYVDGAGCDSNVNGVYGWAKDDDTSGPITVHIYVGGPATAQGTYPAFAVQADQTRSDVGAHAFQWTLPDQFKNGNRYPIYVYGINVPSGNNPTLSNGSGQFVIGPCSGGTTTPAPQPVAPAPAPSGDSPITVYRLYKDGQHFWTADANEYNSLYQGGHNGWSDESPAFYDYSKDSSTGQAVYRIYNSRSGEHFYTVDTNERDGLLGKPCNQQQCWSNENVAWKASGPVAVYRLFNNVSGLHHWTSSNDEAQALQKAANDNGGKGWHIEGTAFYAAQGSVQAVQIQNKCLGVFNCGTSPAPQPAPLPVPTTTPAVAPAAPSTGNTAARCSRLQGVVNFFTRHNCGATTTTVAPTPVPAPAGTPVPPASSGGGRRNRRNSANPACNVGLPSWIASLIGC